MVRSIYTLIKVARELNTKLADSYLAECFTQEKNSLVMLFVGDGSEQYVQFSGGGQEDAVFLRDGFKRARKNTVDLFEDLTHEKFLKARVLPGNRILKFEFVNSLAYAELFGGNKSNFFAATKDNLIFDTLIGADYFTGMRYELPENTQPHLRDFDKSKTLIYALARDENLFGKHYATEICHKANVAGDTLLGELSDIEFELIEEASLDLKQKLLAANEFFLLQKGEDVLLSLVPLREWRVIRSCSSISEAIRRKHVMTMKQKSFEPLQNSLAKLLAREINKTEKLIKNLCEFHAIRDRGERNRLYAELIMTKGDLSSRPGKSIVLEDWEGSPIEIPLDDKKTLNENAAKLFDKAKNAEKQIKVNEKRIPLEEKKLKHLRLFYERVKITDNLKELETLQLEIKRLLGHKMQNAPINREDKFRRFDIGEGYELYVGKSAANNDELTIKFAKPNDIWLHARGTSGSHGVIRMGKEAKPPKRVLELAASIIAYYSGAKNAKYAPVAWTYKKYVRKPKGANTGSVTIAREEVIMVEPGLPPGIIGE